MAQWTGQFRGHTHKTKVQDIEDSLLLAIQTYRTTAEAERSGKLKAICHLAERLLAARLKALRARLSALSEPGSKSLDDTEAAQLRTREQELQAQSVEDILREFEL